MSLPRQLPLLLEALEPRVAPAVLINVGASNAPDGVTDSINSAANSSTPYDQVAFNYVFPIGVAQPPGKANPFVSDGGGFYHVDLSTGKGDALVKEMKIYDEGQGFRSWISIAGGEARAFFKDNGDGIVAVNELVGISYGSNLSLKVGGSVAGDIVGNFAGGAVQSGLVPLATGKASIASLYIGGSVDGDIIGAGALNKITVVGNVKSIATSSDGADTYNFGQGDTPLDAYTPASGVAGGSISGLKLGNVSLIKAGVGGAGGAGGSVSNVTLVADYNGLQILAGDGGIGGAKAAAGGSVSTVYVYGVASPAVIDPAPAVKILAGSGTDLPGLVGGAGGSVSKIYVGYDLNAKNTPVPSPVAPALTVEVGAGSGGDGATGGVGGKTDSVFVYVSTKDVLGKDEVVVFAGDGGAGTSKNGIGGTLSNVKAENYFVAIDDVDLDSMLFKGGNGGAGAGAAANGGSVTKISAMADVVKVRGGDGSSGASSGGNGGLVGDISLLFSESELAQSIGIFGGAGGAGGTGKAGAGGSVAGVTALSVNLDDAASASSIAAGAGGAGDTGGAGGALSKIRIFEGATTTDVASLDFRAGAGGAGVKAGGNGGAISDLTFVGFATTPAAYGGAGGAASNGKGGAGGGLSRLSLYGEASAGNVQAEAGAGGRGEGLSGAGGIGGSVLTANLRGYFDVQIAAGAGGAGVGAVGAGGSVTSVAAVSTDAGSSQVRAGQAGIALGAATKGAAGGSVRTVLAVASEDITISAGNGAAGGAGGSITTAGWYRGTVQTDITAPVGAVTVTAGQGSALGSAAGAGGWISGAAGFASASEAEATLISAGDGGGVGSKASAGGSVANVYLYGGASAADIRAGQGGDSDGGTGGAGGSVTGVSAAPGVNLHSVAAGNGGGKILGSTKATTGGNGGSVSKVNIFGDIGKRSGAVFGIDTMGGIFAGAGGAAAKPGKAGSVNDVTAKAISSIVAGRPTSSNAANFSLATLVDRIYLRGLDAPTLDGKYVDKDPDPSKENWQFESDGNFSSVTSPGELPSNAFPKGKPATVNFYEANLVGAISGDPFAANANVYKTGSGAVSGPETSWVLGTTAIDGLIAAITFGDNHNFRPQALLTVMNPKFPTIDFTLLDYRNNYLVNS